MPRNYYEITYLVITDNDGLVSHTMQKIKDLTALPEEDDDEDNNSIED